MLVRVETSFKYTLKPPLYQRNGLRYQKLIGYLSLSFLFNDDINVRLGVVCDFTF